MQSAKHTDSSGPVAEPTAQPPEAAAESAPEPGQDVGHSQPQRDELPDHGTYAAVEDFDSLDVDTGQIDDH